jgi:hypothetical protein
MLTLPSTDDIVYFNEPFFLDGVIARAANTVAEQKNIPYFSGTLNVSDTSPCLSNICYYSGL